MRSRRVRMTLEIHSTFPLSSLRNKNNLELRHVDENQYSESAGYIYQVQANVIKKK